MKVSSRETLMPTQSAQALDTEPGRTCPVGLSACLIYGTRGAVFPQVLLRRPLACTTHKLPESRFVRWANVERNPVSVRNSIVTLFRREAYSNKIRTARD